MAKKAKAPDSVPAGMQATFDAVVAQTDRFCRQYLNDEYAALCRKMAAVLCRKRSSPLTRGDPAGWAAGILTVLGRTNFLGDPSQRPHMLLAEIGPKLGVGASTAAAKAKKIRELIPTGPLEWEWQLPSRLANNPLVWMLQVNGVLMDIRDAPRAAQEEALRFGLIPFIPGDEGEAEG